MSPRTYDTEGNNPVVSIIIKVNSKINGMIRLYKCEISLVKCMKYI